MLNLVIFSDGWASDRGHSVVDWTYLAKVLTVLGSGKERELVDELRHRQLQKNTLPVHSLCPSCGLDLSG